MRVGVRCGVARPAPAQLRGATQPTQAHRHAKPASRCLHGAGRRARLDQGCASRLVACAAARAKSGPAPLHRRGRACRAAGGEAAQAEPAPHEHTAEEAAATDGAREPDPLTVELLQRPGWFKTEEEVRAVLATLLKRTSWYSTFRYEKAEPVVAWLEARLGREPAKRGGLHPGAKAVKLFPSLLYHDATTLQRKWDALTLPTGHGGVGIDFSEEQAREAVRKYPPVLGLAVDNLASGWSMLTATERGLGLSHEEARRCILRRPDVLRHDYDRVMRRIGLLKDLGYTDAHRMVLAEPRVLDYKDEVVDEHAAWWKQTGLDHVKVITSKPTLLGAPQTTELQAKLDFLSRVAGMSAKELNNAHGLFTLSLGRLRARYFYALLKGRLARFTSMNTMMKETDATFLAMLQGGSYTERASDLEVKRYQKLVASAKFVAWRERQEAQRRSRAAA